MKEIARILFMSLNVDKYGYYILCDGYFREKFYAENDTKAKEYFYEKYGK